MADHESPLRAVVLKRTPKRSPDPFRTRSRGEVVAKEHGDRVVSAEFVRGADLNTSPGVKTRRAMAADLFGVAEVPNARPVPAPPE